LNELYGVIVFLRITVAENDRDAIAIIAITTISGAIQIPHI
jgi:hypothetical protein